MNPDIANALARHVCPINAMPVMFKGGHGWRCLGYVRKVSTALDARPLADRLLINNHLSAQKISIAEIDAGRFIACHG